MPLISTQRSNPSGVEARGEPRRRVLFSGLIVHSAAQMSIHCAILDMSRKGARVRLNGADMIGDPIYLIDLNHALAFGARVVGRRSAQLSLSFNRYFDLTKPAPGTPPVLRRLWISHTRAESAP